MFDHVRIRVSDRDTSERFYDTVLGALDIEKTYSDEHLVEWNEFSLAVANSERPATRRLHAGFAAASWHVVDEFWRVGTEAGYRDDGAPGPLRELLRQLLLDPDGNSMEAVHAEHVRDRGIDHLWIRVADRRRGGSTSSSGATPASALRRDTVDRVRFAGEDRSGSFSLVRGTPTDNELVNHNR